MRNNSTSQIRKRSLQQAAKLGFMMNEALPWLDDDLRPRPFEEVTGRLLSMLPVAASAHGFDRIKAQAWIEQEKLGDYLTRGERRFIEHGEGAPNLFIVQIEGMWALAWALGLVSELDFSDYSDNRFVSMLPNLKIAEGSAVLRSRLRLRSVEEIMAACDLAYCLHWAIMEAQRFHAKPPGKVEPYVITERRRALEWVLSDDAWDEVLLDT